MHGGRSTGPRTPEGMQRLRDAHTVHGRYGAEARTRSRQLITIGARTQVYLSVLCYARSLPPELAARLHPIPREFVFPPYPAKPISVAQDRAMRQAEAEALAPWRQAIAAIRALKKPHAPVCAAAGGSAPRHAGMQSPPRSVASGQATDPRACRPETRTGEQDPMHLLDAADAGAGHVSGAALPAADPGAAVRAGPKPGSGSPPGPAQAAASAPAARRLQVPERSAFADSAAELHAPGRQQRQPSAPARPPSALHRAAVARPLAPVAVAPACCLSAPPSGATHAAGMRQHLLAGTGAGSIALMQAFAAAGRAVHRVTR